MKNREITGPNDINADILNVEVWWRQMHERLLNFINNFWKYKKVSKHKVDVMSVYNKWERKML